jgi:hypothetical protein
VQKHVYNEKPSVRLLNYILETRNEFPNFQPTPMILGKKFKRNTEKV